MESSSQDDFIIGNYKNEKKKEHQENIKRIEKNLAELGNDTTKDGIAKIEDYQKEFKYHKMRLTCIDGFEKNHKVPKIIVEDKYFNKDEIKQNQELTEELYPENKEISLREKSRRQSEICYKTARRSFDMLFYGVDFRSY